MRPAVKGWLADCRWGVGLLLAEAPGVLAAWLLLLLVSAAAPLALLGLLHRVLGLLQGGPGHTLLPWLIGLLGLFVLLPLLNQSRQWLHGRLAERVQTSMQDHLHRVVTALPFELFDRGQHYDRLHRMRSDLLSQPLLLVEHLGQLCQSGLFLALLAGSLLLYRPDILLGLGLAALAALALGVWHAAHQIRFQRRLARLQRQANYLSFVMTDRQPAADLRLLGLAGYFRQRFLQAQIVLHQLQRRLDNRSWWVSLWSSLLLGAGLVWTAYCLYRDWALGALLLADLVVLAQGLWLALRIQGQLVESAIRVARAGLFMQEIRAFLTDPPRYKQADLAPVMTTCPAPEAALCLDRVGFCYEGARQPALQDFSLTVPKGQICALVGGNGAGKSTVLKLLAGLYQPQSGGIWLNGAPAATLDEASRREQMGVLLQEPMHFQGSAAENLRLDRVLPEGHYQAALQAADAHSLLAGLPEGEQTLLGRLFGGVELSGGQWQRLCLARILAGEQPIMLLDEPTSALDGWSEIDWFARLRRWAQGRTIILVTHRFSTAKQADCIQVMEAGRIVERGNHEQLLALGGRYAAAWRTPQSAEAPAPAL
ncbi:ATP-binding cassette domain-containing protein [Pseudaeromonas sp. ZJS20]|uniref:ABC transporter ATP-binding protein n=1 Tax=Pseudaeromonas aegiceratis TaxID=3153928 RepID=UPI00390C87C8